MEFSTQRGDRILDFEALSRKDTPLVGGKNSSLGELIKAGLPVPPGFAITARAFDDFVGLSGLKKLIRDTLSDIDPDDVDNLLEKSAQLRSYIEKKPMPQDLEREIRAAYRRLGEKLQVQNPEVAVRSSATAEDLPTASFAGQQETYLFVSNEENVLTAVRRCFGSLFTPRAISYRREKGFDDLGVKASVGVQKMLNSKSAGVIFTIDPATGDSSVIVIEGAWGVGESVAQGHVDPDRFVVSKSNLQIVDRQVSDKRVMTIRDSTGYNAVFSKEVEVPSKIREKPCLTDEQIVDLARYALKIEEHYRRPMDIEWVLDSETGKLFVVQARPETVWAIRKEAKVGMAPQVVKAEEAKILIRGLGASPGIASGRVHVIRDVKKIGEFREGEVLVTEMTAPDWVPAMRKAAGIVTEGGGMTAHAAIVSRELGIPCIVGTKTAMNVLETGRMVTVDGALGVVYEGVVEEEKKKAPPVRVAEVAPITGTKVYMNLGEPGKIDEYKHLPFDGIGLMRIEFIIADWVGEHPLHLIAQGRDGVFVDKLVAGIAKVAQAAYPRPIVVRFSDFKSNEYNSLKGGEKYEPQEANPMLGWRGLSRYVSLEYEPAFRLECKAVKKVRDEMGLKNVWVMLPFARTTWEIEKALKIMQEEGLERNRDFKAWIMAEVPSVIMLADEFSKLCDGISIGSNDLTQLILGADRDSGILGGLGYFDERDPAVLRSMGHLIKTAHEYNVTVSICGQAPSVYPELTAFLVECGIDSVSVNPDTVVETKKLVASVEQKAILKRLAQERDPDFKPKW